MHIEANLATAIGLLPSGVAMLRGEEFEKDRILNSARNLHIKLVCDLSLWSLSSINLSDSIRFYLSIDPTCEIL